MKDMDKLLEVSIAAERLGIADKTLYGLIKAKKIGHLLVGVKKGYRIPESEIQKFIKRRLVEAELY